MDGLENYFALHSIVPNGQHRLQIPIQTSWSETEK